MLLTRLASAPKSGRRGQLLLRQHSAEVALRGAQVQLHPDLKGSAREIGELSWKIID